MLEFNANNVEELEAEARERAHEVSINVVTSVIKALEANVDKVIIEFRGNFIRVCYVFIIVNKVLTGF